MKVNIPFGDLCANYSNIHNYSKLITSNKPFTSNKQVIHIIKMYLCFFFQKLVEISKLGLQPLLFYNLQFLH
jgi:hypothetical protein